MKNVIISLILGILATLLAAFIYINFDLCNCNDTDNSNLNVVDKTKVEPKVNETVNSVFKILNPDLSTGIEMNGELLINNKNSFVILNDEIKGLPKQIYEHLNTNLDQALEISSVYKSTEKSNNSNFGKDRSQFLKDLIVKFGVNPDRIIVNDTLFSYSYDKDGNYNNGVFLKFNTVNKELKEIIKKGIENKILYSEYGAKEFLPDNTIKAYIIELKEYLEENPSKKIQIIGHTDSDSSANFNLSLSKKRADLVKNYFIENDIPASKLRSIGKGETSPIASNDTEEGKAKNRRTEIKIN